MTRSPCQPITELLSLVGLLLNKLLYFVEPSQLNYWQSVTYNTFGVFLLTHQNVWIICINEDRVNYNKSLLGFIRRHSLEDWGMFMCCLFIYYICTCPTNLVCGQILHVYVHACLVQITAGVCMRAHEHIRAQTHRNQSVSQYKIVCLYIYITLSNSLIIHLHQHSLWH